MNTNQGKIKAFFQHRSAYPVILFVISFLSYGLLSPWMKFFHDEYSLFWFYYRAQNISLFFEGNRPFLAYFYIFFFNIFNTNAYLWCLFSVFSRWFFALCLFWLIIEIWPENRTLGMLSSFLCVVYPAFQAQYASVIFGILFLLFSIFLLSLILMLKAFYEKKNGFFFTDHLSPVFPDKPNIHRVFLYTGDTALSDYLFPFRKRRTDFAKNIFYEILFVSCALSRDDCQAAFHAGGRDDLQV